MTEPGANVFAPETQELLACAEVQCARRGVRLTKLRRTVLGLVIESPRPAGAYDLLARLEPAHGHAAPPTVYRALEFLLEEGLIHRIERLSAYVACVHHLQHHHHEAATGHTAQFLICRTCGRVTELHDAELAAALARATAGQGFRPDSATVEALGVCIGCAPAKVSLAVPPP